MTGDLILVEVLQGFRAETDFRRALDLDWSLYRWLVTKSPSGRRGIIELCGVRA
jgi:hypothetical protein